MLIAATGPNGFNHEHGAIACRPRPSRIRDRGQVLNPRDVAFACNDLSGQVCTDRWLIFVVTQNIGARPQALAAQGIHS
jgi:hypothetical protein